jgi:hypothetical protein
VRESEFDRLVLGEPRELLALTGGRCREDERYDEGDGEREASGGAG